MGHDHCHTTPIHYSQDRVNQHLKTIRGQIDGIIKMYDENRYCVDISKQILSLVSLLQKTNALILSDHLSSCVTEAIRENKGEEKIAEITEILTTYYK